MTQTGYNIYRGEGGDSNVDYSAPIGTSASPGVSLVALGHKPSTRYVYVVRPVLDGLESPDVSCRLDFETDEQGNWAGQLPGAVQWLGVDIAPEMQVVLRWRYKTELLQQPPESFCLYVSQNKNIMPGSPQLIIEYTHDGIYSHTLSIGSAGAYYFAVTARSSAGVESPVSAINGPVALISRSPAKPNVLFSATFKP